MLEFGTYKATMCFGKRERLVDSAMNVCMAASSFFFLPYIENLLRVFCFILLCILNELPLLSPADQNMSIAC